MNKIFSFFHEVMAELRKVTWPKQDDLIGSTIIVVVFVFCFAVILASMDSAFSLVIKKLLGQGRI